MLPPPDSLAAKALRTTLYGAVRMPRSAAIALYGPPPQNDRGASLDFQVHVLLRLMSQSGRPDFAELGAERARVVYERANRLFDLAPRPMHAVEDRVIEGHHGPIPLRIYRPKEGELPACVYLHGGGFVIGNLAGYDGFCRALALASETVVISVDYRLAPEHAFPDPIDDCVDAYRWVREAAASLGVDPDKIAIAGDSAGANLATVACAQLAKSHQVSPAHQLLIYPKTDYRHDLYPSRELFSEGYFLNAPMIEWFASNYLAGAQVHDDPRVSPIHFDELSCLPPATIITAGFDPLRDEGEAYADRLAAAGVAVTRRCYDELVHGFTTMGGIVDAAAHAVEGIAEDFRDALKRH